MPTAPTSACDHEIGNAPPPAPDVTTLTFANSDWLRIVGSWLVTASPTSSLPASVAVPNVVHVVPSVDTEAVTVEPARVSFNHARDVTDAPAINEVLAPIDA